MNTTSHPLTTYWLFRNRPHAGAAAFASFLPDAPYLVALAWGLARYGIGWRGVLEAWSNPIANFATQKVSHNLVLATAFGIIALASRRPLLRAIAAGWSLHVVVDLSLHVRDAYSVLWPFTVRVFPAPVSYWHPEFHGETVGTLLSVAACALWIWLGQRLATPRTPLAAFVEARRRSAAGWKRPLRTYACWIVALISMAGPVAQAVAGGPSGSGPSGRWIDDGIHWPAGLAPIAALVDAGDVAPALEALANPDPGWDTGAPPPGAPAWEEGAPGARTHLLRAFALDLMGRRADALVQYRRAERLEPVGDLGDKARRHQGEPWRNEPDPLVSWPWLGLALWGTALSVILVRAVERRP